MEQKIRRLTQREGYAVLLTAEFSVSLPHGSVRMTDFTVRDGELMLRNLYRKEGERARTEYLAAESNTERARWRVRRLHLAARSEPIAAGFCRVVRTADLNGSVLQTVRWIWNLEEETLLPPAQARRMERKCGGKRRTSTKN